MDLKDLKVHYYRDTVQVVDSYKVSKRDIPHIVIQIRLHELCSRSLLETTSYKNMIHEWRAHNLLYKLHYKRERTGSVDFNNNSKLLKLAYFILSLIY